MTGNDPRFRDGGLIAGHFSAPRSSNGVSAW